jgi:multimeric flavodoxin WrbA
MRVLAVVGSPRKRGNTDLLVDALLRGAEEGGAIVEKVYLADKDIKPCDGCDVCFTNGECVHDDDMVALYEKLLECEVWALGTPVYWWGPTAQMKAFIDRWYFLTDQHRGALEGKRAVLVAPFGDDDPETARHLVGMFAAAFKYLKMDFAGQILVTASEKGEVASNAAALEEARSLGQRLAAGQ